MMAKRKSNKSKKLWGSKATSKSKLLLVALAFAVVGAGYVFVSSASIEGVRNFSDTPRWARSAIEWITYDYTQDQVAPMMTGFNNNTFRPNENLTRAQFASAMFKFAYEPQGAHFTGKFSDHPAWAADAVTWITDPISSGSAEPVMTGYPNGTFRPNNALTRAQFASALYKYAGQPAPAGELKTFSDTPAWAKSAIDWITASDLEIMTGFERGTFRPNNPLTRAQFASALYKYAGQPAPNFRRKDNKLYITELTVNYQSANHPNVTYNDTVVLDREFQRASGPVVYAGSALAHPEATKESIQLQRFVALNPGKRFKVCAKVRVTESGKRSSIDLRFNNEVVFGNIDNGDRPNFTENSHIIDSTTFKEKCSEFELKTATGNEGSSLDVLGFIQDSGSTGPQDDEPGHYWPFEAPIEVDTFSIQAL